MREISNHLKLIAETLSMLAKQFEKLSDDVNKIQFPAVESEYRETAPEEKSIAEEATAPAVKVKKPVRKAKAPAPGKTTTVKAQKETGKPLPILATIYDIVKSSRKGVDISTLKEKTDFKHRQISNALYKLSKIQGKIEIKARGVYVAKKK